VSRIKVYLMIFVLILSLNLSVECAEKTLLTEETDNGGYGGISMKITQIKDKGALMAGAEGAWIINHSFILGASGFGLTGGTLKGTEFGSENANELNMWYSGLKAGFIINSDDILHYVFHVTGGVGSLKYRDGIDKRFTFIEPGIDLELNFYDNVRLTFGIMMFVTSGAQVDGIPNPDFNKPSLYLSYKWGKF
jgi:hypothetical protein